MTSSPSRVAGDYKRLQAQVAALNPENPAARALVEQAKPEIDAGHFARAHELLRQATQAQIAAAQEARKLREQAQAAEDGQMLGAASSTAAEGGVALTERRYKEAADLFGQAAGYVPSGHQSERGGYLLRQADALYRQGDERGDNAALRSSIEVYGRALAEYARERVPLDWATTQNNLGIALWRLGERESGTARLEEAVAAYRAALEERTRERVPLDWAAAQNNLGLRSKASGSGRAGRRGSRRRSRPIAPRWRKRRASGFRSTGRRRRPISALRSQASASGRAGRRGSSRRWRPIAPRWRNSRASGFRSTGRRRRPISAMRSRRSASGRAGRRGSSRRSRPIAQLWRRGRASGFRSTGRRRR